MDFNIETIGDIVVVLLPGETLEASITLEFKQGIEPILEENTKMVFDMSQIRFIDSMGCGVLLTSLKGLKNKGGGLKLCCITDPVDSIFKLMGFDRIFSIFEMREDAVNAFKSSD
jgi:anti-anti-sigma factor